MFQLGLPRPALSQFLATLAGSYDLRVRVQVVDLDQLPVSDITSRVFDGQVTVDWDGEDATRAMSLSAFDPNYDLGFDNADSGSGVWFLDRMMHVVVEVAVDEDFVVECPIFTGPIRKFKRTGDVVTLDCVGKDIFTRRAWTRSNFTKGTPKVDAILTVLEEAGEAFFRGFDDVPNDRLTTAVTVDRNMIYSPWGWARVVAQSMGYRLYYDGAGYATLARLYRDQPIFTFRDGNGGMVLSEPDTDGDYSEMANVVRAEGQVSGKTNPYYEAFVDSTSPLHPANLRRNGKPMYLGVVVQRESITSAEAAKKVALEELASRQQAAYTTSFDSLPMYLLEEQDCVRLVVDDKAVTFNATKFAFGFRPDAVMPVGHTRSVAPRLARIRRY